MCPNTPAMARTEPRRIYVACGEFRPRGFDGSRKQSNVFVSFLVPFWLKFGCILSLGGCPETPWSPFASHLCPRTFQNAISGSFWQPLGTPFGTLLESIFGSGPALEALGQHFGTIFDPLGRLSVSTSFWDLENEQKL